jgi:hypothetical protein
MLRSGATAAPTWSTATYPATAGSSGNVLTSDGTNWASAAPAASATSVIVDDTTTNATMYPTWVTANTGSLPLKVTSTKLSFNPSTGTLVLTGKLASITDIVSSAGLTLLKTNYTASAVNYIGMQNNTTGNNPVISAAGTDTNISLDILGQGTGGINLIGVSTNSNAPTSYVGEFIFSTILQASAVTLTDSIVANVTSISLTAGDWDVWGNISYFCSAASVNNIFSWINNTSATQPDIAYMSYIQSLVAAQNLAQTVPSRRFSLSGTTTIYLSGFMGFASGTGKACGGIYARRRR